MLIPVTVAARDEMTTAQFDQMMATGVEQAKEDDSFLVSKGGEGCRGAREEGISEPGRDISPSLTGPATPLAPCSLNNTPKFSYSVSSNPPVHVFHLKSQSAIDI